MSFFEILKIFLKNKEKLARIVTQEVSQKERKQRYGKGGARKGVIVYLVNKNMNKEGWGKTEYTELIRASKSDKEYVRAIKGRVSMAKKLSEIIQFFRENNQIKD